MAFCNGCGAALTAGTRFCSKCGAPILASTLPPSAPPPGAPSAANTAGAAPSSIPPAQPAAGGSNALKIVLLVVGGLVVLGLIGAAAVGTFAWRLAHHSHVRQDGNNVRVETPFGTVQTTKDPQEAARNLGVDLYPGAQVTNDGASSTNFGGMHTATLNFETTDSPEKVCDFYKPKFPHAMVVTHESNQCNIVSHEHDNMITINVQGEGDKARIVITSVRRSGGSNSSSN